jgi:hypothetical protein
MKTTSCTQQAQALRFVSTMWLAKDGGCSVKPSARRFAGLSDLL